MIDINGFESKVSQSSDVYGTTAGPISIRGGGETEREELPLNRFVRTVRFLNERFYQACMFMFNYFTLTAMKTAYYCH